MTLGPLMVDIQGQELSADDKRLLANPLVGGVILFSRNYHSLEQLQALVQTIRDIKNPRLLIAVDQEGGRVQRFKDGFTILPAMRRFGNIYDKDHELALNLCEQCGWLMASEICSTGIDISFAPVLDLDKGISTVIGDRAFHHNPFVVSKLSQAFITGMKKAGMQATGKHFPGHGSIAADSHTDMPIDDRPWIDIEMEDLRPFQFMIEAGINALMMAHVIYPAVDKLPAGFSKHWIGQILRTKLNYQGAIFSDDLDMQGAAVAGNFPERAKLSLEAGCDMILVCNNRPACWSVVESLQGYESPASSLRLAHLHSKHSLCRADLVNEPRWREVKHQIAKYVEEPSLNLL